LKLKSIINKFSKKTAEKSDLTIRTDTEKDHSVGCKGKAMFFGLLCLQILDDRIVELQLLMASLTDNVVVVSIFIAAFVPDNTVTEDDLISYPGFREKFQGSIDSGLADGRVSGLDQIVQLLGGNMLPLTQKGVQDKGPLRGKFQFFIRQELSE